MRHLYYEIYMTSNGGFTISDLTYDDRSGADFVTVEAVPERRGVLIKTVEYAVISKKNCCQVNRRYKDFLVFRELLLLRFAYRTIPKLPPKKISIVVDSQHVEERRKALQRFLNVINRHPAMGSDVLVKYFLTVQERDIYQTMKNHFATLPDEFFVHPSSLQALTLLHENTTRDYKKHRENIDKILIAISRLHDMISARLKRSESEAGDLREIDKVLKELAGSSSSLPSSPTRKDSSASSKDKHLLASLPKWLADSESSMIENSCSNMSKIAPRFTEVATCTAEKARSEENSVLDKLSLLIDVIIGYQELCQRHEKGVTGEHHRAIRQLNNLKKLTSGGGNTGLTETPQNLDAIEQTVNQREAEIATIEQRNAFALYCVQEETRLVYCYMALLNGILVDLATANADSLGELSNVWRDIRNCAVPTPQSKGSISNSPARKPLTGRK